MIVIRGQLLLSDERWDAIKQSKQAERQRPIISVYVLAELSER